MILTSADAAKATQVAHIMTMTQQQQQQQQQQKQPSSSSSSNNNTDQRNGGTLSLSGLELIGPSGTQAYVRSLRHFVRRDDFKVTIREGHYQLAPAVSQEVVSRDNRLNKKKRKKQSHTASASSTMEEQQQQPSTNYFGVQTIPLSYQIPTLTSTTTTTTTTKTTKPVQVISYLFTTPPISGKFLVEKAKELGIPPGPLYTRLKSGSSITFTSNNTGQECHVEPSQVVQPSTPGMIVAVLYYPTMEVWKSLQPKLNELLVLPKNQPMPTQTQTTTTAQAQLELVVHMTTPQLFHDPVCQQWRQNLSSSQQPPDQLQQDNNNTNNTSLPHHLFLESSDPALWAPSSQGTRDSHPSPFTSACIGALVRSKICPQVYRTPDFLQQQQQPFLVGGSDTKDHDQPITKTTLPQQQQYHKSFDNKNDKDDDAAVRIATPLLEYVLVPRSRKGYAEHVVSANYLEERRNEGMEWLLQSGAWNHAQEILTLLPPLDNNSRDSSSSKAELLMTGTGSAVPCKHRNVTGMCLRMDDGQGIMLDIGEGTVGQLLRASTTRSGGREDDDDDQRSGQALLLKSIQAAWISHPHADHHLGLLRLLTDRQSAIRSGDNTTAGENTPLLVIAPPPILDFLREYEQIDPRIASSYIPLDCREIVHDPNRPRLTMPRAIRDNPLMGSSGISRWEAIPVSHCPFSFAIVLEGTSFGTVAYSGDCRPSAKFAERARNADLLIHEATFEDGMEAEATMKRHSTVGEAIKVAQEMKAKQLVLTHFSQRYPKIPPVANGASAGDGGDIPVIFAFDFMALTPNNLNMASSVTPAMRDLFPEVVETGAPVQEGAIADAAMAIPGFFAQNPYD
jgi:ribonuclease Z